MLIKIMSLDDVRKEIGDKRAEEVKKFRELVDRRDYAEAKNFYESSSNQFDLRKYARAHLSELSTNLSGF